jgi:DNA-nicking Smr family endonuclease
LRPLDSREYDRLRKKQRRIDARLDLHGMSEAAAHAALLSFVQRAAQQNMRSLLIITGKGRNGEGALRRHFKDWLEASRDTRGLISGISSAGPSHGGDGAFYVTLKRSD